METAALIWMILLLALAATTAAFALPRRAPRPAAPSPTTRPASRTTGAGSPAIRAASRTTSAGSPAIRAASPTTGVASPVTRAASRTAGAASSTARAAAAPARWAVAGRVGRAAETGCYADEVVLAAERAAETARQRRAAWEEAQEEVDAAWAAYDDADRIARRCAAAAAFPMLKQRRTRAEIADRERFLHSRALAACRQRELSIEQLNEVLAHRSGWNERKHPVAQETALRAAVREHRFAEYQAATQRERQAWEQSERAAADLRDLRAEALSATIGLGRSAAQQRRRPAPRTAPRAVPTTPAVARLASVIGSEAAGPAVARLASVIGSEAAGRPEAVGRHEGSRSAPARLAVH